MSYFENMKIEEQGFTFLQAIITIALLGLLLTLGMPSFQELLRNHHLITETNTLVAALSTARSEAINRRVRVTICKSNNQSSCTPTAQWEDGWIIFSDIDKDGTYDGAPENLIVVSAGLSEDNTLRAYSNFVDYISYRPNGESHGNPNNDGTFNLCDDRGAAAGRAIQIISTGRIRIRQGADTCP